MENRTSLRSGLWRGLAERLRNHKKLLGMLGVAAAGYVMAGSRVFGDVAPFGPAFCAAVSPPYTLAAALGTLLGYVFPHGATQNLKYLAAVILVLGLQRLFADKGEKSASALKSAAIALLSLGVSGVVLAVVSDAALYDVLQLAAEVFLCAGAAYFFSRTLAAMQAGWGAVNRSDVSCMIVSFGIVIMGFSSITFAGISVGRVLAVIIVLLCARAGAEAGGAVAGVAAGLAMGLAGGDYAYAISAYGFGGLMAGVFSGLGRIATAAAFIIINLIATLFTKSTGEIYTALFEIFIASVVFAAVPRSVVARFRLAKLDRTLEGEVSAQGALQERLCEIADALREIGTTTREVSQRLGKLERDKPGDLYSRVADRVCTHCGLRTTCWQDRYSDTMNAMNDAMLILKQEGTISRARMPTYFTETCCKAEEFTAELNIQFGAQVARQGVQRKVARVRGVLTDQFEGIASMLEDVCGELCGVRLLDAPRLRQVREYFESEGLQVQRVRCYSDAYEHITVEVSIPAYEKARLDGPAQALDLSELLETEFDIPYVNKREGSVTAVFAEKAAFSLETGVYQIPPQGNALCGDAYELILNRAGHAHLMISDGMGSGGGAAVDSHMAVGLLSRLLKVGFTYDSALKMVNSALLVKSGEESLATIDACTVDLYTGQTVFYKAGAAPSFIVRGDRTGLVQSTSLPAGILQGVGFDKSSCSLQQGDILVLVSDGVVATGSDWVRSELAAMAGEDMQRLAEKLAMTAKIRRTDGREDDITVLAATLRKS